MSTLTVEQTQKIADWLDEHPRLAVGVGTREEACSVAAINLALTGELTDSIPDCMSLVVGEWIIGVQDAMPAEIRDSLGWRDLLPLAAGTGRDRERERLGIILDWMWGTVLPHLQGLADEGGFGIEWRRMIEERSQKAAEAAAWAADAARAAARVSGAARAASWAAWAVADAAWEAAAGAWEAARAARAAASWAASGEAWELFDPVGLLRRLVEVSDD